MGVFRSSRTLLIGEIGQGIEYGELLHLAKSYTDSTLAIYC